MKAKLILSGLLTLLLVASVVSADNTVYLEPQTVYVPECGDATVQIRLNSTDTIDTWSTRVEFGSECVNITDVSFAEGITSEYANWGHHAGYIYLGGVSPDGATGDHLLVTLTVECVDGSCGSVDLSIVGGTDERLIAGPGGNDPPHATIYPATWMGGSAQIVGCGDVNCDVDVTPADAGKAFKRYLDSGYPLDLPWAVDVNCDGSVTPADAGKIFKRYLDSSYVLECCCE